MTDYASLVREGRSFPLSGPACRHEHMAVRGDLAHIALAGKIFVPHYAVPAAYTATGETALRNAARDDSELVSMLAPGADFAVLDIAGEWAWGTLDGVDGDGESSPCGYVRIADLVRAR